MGKQSRRSECPVCNDAFADCDSVPDNALACKNAHAMRRQDGVPADKVRGSGLAYKCPLCRSHACLQNIHLLVIAKGSWNKAYDWFPCKPSAEAWNEQVPPPLCDEE